MTQLGLDAVVFPAVADVGPADADVNEESAVAAWRNGVWVANGNLAIRHLGIPTVTVPMGTMADIGMPVGLTFAGAGVLRLRPAAVGRGLRVAAPAAHRAAAHARALTSAPRQGDVAAAGGQLARLSPDPRCFDDADAAAAQSRRAAAARAPAGAAPCR